VDARIADASTHSETRSDPCGTLERERGGIIDAIDGSRSSAPRHDRVFADPLKHETRKEVNRMSKEFRCGDVIPGCPTVIEGKDDKEVIAKATEHAKNVHHMESIPPDVVNKVQKAIHNK
jgi:predicted small metal-binding protein